METWTDRDERQAAARAEYERIMRSPSPDPGSAYIDVGVIGFVFGEMWRRGVLTARDRRFITLACLGSTDAAVPIETHVWAARSSGDITVEEFDEFVLHFATQLGWPKASVLGMHGMLATAKLAEQGGQEVASLDFEPWTDPVPEEVRHARGESAYRAVQGREAPPASTAFSRGPYLDFLYGEIWTRDRHLSNRDRRLISICCCAAVGVASETRDHLAAALSNGELTREELEELVVHFAVYVGWALGRQLDDLLMDVVQSS